MKKFVAGLTVGIMIMSCTFAYADTIEAIFGQVKIVVDGKPIEQESLLYNNTTYVPLRAVSSALGEAVNYDDTTKTAYIGEMPEDINIESTSTPEQNVVATSEIPLPQLEKPKNGDTIAIITTNKGTIKMKLFPEQAPKAVENFTTHATEGYYDGLIFHRAVDNFVIQGGDPSGDGTGGESIWGEPFEDEISPSLHHISGAVAMANLGPDTNSSQFYIVENDKLTNQEVEILNEMKTQSDKEVGQNANGEPILLKSLFPEAIIDQYLKTGGSPYLDIGILSEVNETINMGGYTVFGQVIEGMDVVHAIAEVEVDENDKPKEDIIIEKIEIVPYESAPAAN